MPDFDEKKDFFDRCKISEFQEKVDEYLSEIKEHQDKYYKSEHYLANARKCNMKRYDMMRESYIELSWYEKKLIRKFYQDCPEGYEVDHIIPVSKGGHHKLSNLQYLTKKENRAKASRENKDITM